MFVSLQLFGLYLRHIHWCLTLCQAPGLKDPTVLEGSPCAGGIQSSHLIDPGGLPRGGDVRAESHRMSRSQTGQRVRIPPCGTEQSQSD